MFQNDELKSHLESSHSVQSESAVIAEWNMNIPGNIQKLGNYRRRVSGTAYRVMPNFFDPQDSGGFYTGATDSDIVVESGLEEDSSTPQLYTYPKDKEKALYSLEDCLKPFRPRSGINKLSYFNGKYLPFANRDMYLRPRYYMSTRDDEFKYWRSYRTESDVNDYNLNIEYGISKNSDSGRYDIEDTNPFVVYKEPVPANRLIVKVQTNIGSIDLGPFRTSGSEDIDDPFYGDANKTTPRIFKVQYLDSNNQWLDAYSFDDASLRDDQISPIFGPDGYLSLEYGIAIPAGYKNNFVLVSTEKTSVVLPSSTVVGHAYLVVTEANTKGTLFIFNGVTYDQIVPEYKWFIGTDGTYENTHFVTDFTNPPSFNEAGQGEDTYREFVWVKGIRILVETMNVPNVPLELIEMSPRLVANLSDSLISFSVTKALADLSGSALPVGQLLAGVGELSLFDGDQSFNTNNEWDFETNTGSIIAKHIDKTIKFVFYEVIKNVNASNYYVPIKSMYSEGFPERDARTGETTMSLRDFYFHLESMASPSILLNEVSLSQAIAILLDSVGFSNYVFKRLDSQADPIIPNFFVPPEQNVAQTLELLAQATQSAMFFDEFNNFVVMTKEYILDESVDRLPVSTIYGSDSEDGKLANIISIAAKDKKVYNSGQVNYTTRYIKRTGGTIGLSTLNDKNYVYNPSLLWEVAPTETTRTANASTQEGYALSAVPLNTSLSANVPTVSNDGVIIDNTFDLGENAYFVSRYKGFFYANGEIIKYDAVEYNITGTGNVWISSSLEYQGYMSKLPFNGKIYPTGLVRIYAEPFYETVTGISITQNNQEIGESIRLKPGPVVAHGRGQFGTEIVSHSAGLDPYWSDNANVNGCDMDSSLLFNTEIDPQVPATVIGAAGVNKSIAQKTQRNGIIRNFLSTRFNTESDVTSLKTVNSGTVQSSALVMTGPDFDPAATPRNFVSYVNKKLDGAYKHFGTRVRIIGKVEAAGTKAQTIVGGMTYFNVIGKDPTASISIGGGSAGINIVNPDTNNGYYFEIAAVTTGSLESYMEKNEQGEATISLENILFYKVKKNADGSSKAVPIKLWGGTGVIVIDEGTFVGKNRYLGETTPTVYDLAIEYVDVTSTRRDFFLYINQKLIARVTDNEPIPLVNTSMGLFVRGTSKAMFENVYALSKNYATNQVFDTNVPIASVFGDDDNQVNASEALNKYALSGMIQSTYLSNITPSGDKGYNLYYEEFGSIMREAAYFDIKYDRAFPAMYAKIAPTFNRLKTYSVSGFTADSYGAEFLVFNNTDSAIELDAKTGNFLRIIGIAFTQDTTHTLTVDEYLKKKGSKSDPELQGSTVVESPFKYIEQYDKVRQSRALYGKNDFTIESMYIQDQDSAEDILGWVISKNLRPRKSVGLNIFASPILQLGDIVNISYKDADGIDLVTSDTTKFVVYNITYGRSSAGPDMTVYLSEV